MKLNNIPIGRRLSITFAILMIMIFLIGAMLIVQTSALWSSTKKLYEHPYAVSIAIRDIRSSIYSMNRSMTMIIGLDNRDELVEIGAQLENTEVFVQERFELIKERYLGDGADIQNSYSSYIKSKRIRSEVISLIRDGKSSEALSFMKSVGITQMDELLQDIQKLQDFAETKGETFFEESRRTHKSTNALVLFSLLLLLTISLFVSYFLIRSITKPLRHLRCVALEIEEGNWDQKVNLEGKDELAYLGHAINRMLTSLQDRTDQERNHRLLGDSMIAAKQMEEFGDNLVSTISRAFSAEVGAFYTINKNRTHFEPIFCLGLDKDKLPKFKAGSYEGGIGHSIKSGQIERALKSASNSSFSYKTVLGDVIPNELVTVPICYKEDIYSILIIGKTSNFSKNELSFLETTLPVITSALSNLLREDETQNLNLNLNDKNQELQAQTEELATQSEELMSLTQELQSQNKQLETVEVELRKEKQNLDITVKERTSELEQAKIHAEESDLLKTAFLANMSHEIRTPMNAILGFSELLIDSELSDQEMSDYVGIINDNGEHLLHLINDIIEISKIEAGEFTIHQEEFVPADLLVEVYKSYNNDPNLREKNLDVNLILPDKTKSHTINSDYHRIKQVLNNLVNNAIKFTSSGYIEFGYKMNGNEGKDMDLWVKDTGIGISEDQITKIFRRFVQAENSLNKKYEGTGLGLAISDGIVQLLGGKIEVESKEGKGTTFYVRIPSL